MWNASHATKHADHVDDHVNSAADVDADVRTAVDVVVSYVVDDITATAPEGLISSDNSSDHEQRVLLLHRRQ